MQKFFLGLVALGLMSSFLTGCASSEVTSDQAKEWQNQGREEGDIATDPNGQPVDGRTDR